MIPIAPGSTAPVYNCHVLLRKPRAAGELFTARCAAAPDVSAQGSTEREALQSLVIRFKYFIQEHLANRQEIPWLNPEAACEPGEVDRWISVHL